MNKLYILGALALANVDAALSLGAIFTGAYPLIHIIPATGLLLGSYTYTLTGDCFTAGTATTLGMNNIYHQYYSFTIAKGTAGIFSISGTLGTAVTTPVLTSGSVAVNGCSH
jgi:hypothetical protein